MAQTLLDVGWRNVLNIVFTEIPPFLLFDIASSFRDKINSLSDIPRQITVYGETYILGGITSFVQSHAYYVGYIPYTGGFLFYNGLPPTNPILKRYDMTNIHGDISLLVYFPVENDNTISKQNEIQVECTVNADSEPLSQLKDIPIINDAHPDTSSQVILPNKVNKYSNDFEQTPDYHVISDQLHAKALSELENENIYERPRGKSYRRTKEDNSNNNSPWLNIALCLSPSSPPSSPYNIYSCNDQDSTVNIEIMEFINKKKDFLSWTLFPMHLTRRNTTYDQRESWR